MSAFSAHALGDLWRLGAMDEQALAFARLDGEEPMLPSSFRVSTAAQASLAASALAAAELRYARGWSRQRVAVDLRHAAAECCSHFSLNGVVPNLWDKLSGLYRCGPEGQGRWVRVHANFAHHRDGILRLLGLPTGPDVDRALVQAALASWDAFELEEAAAHRGLVAAAVRSFEEWDLHPQGVAVSGLTLIEFEFLGDAPPRPLRALGRHERPLAGVRVLELTRIIAGPVGGRALAAQGADVLLVNSPHLPNIEAIAETSRGRLSAHVDLNEPTGVERLRRLAADAHVLVQSYRPGALAARGLSARQLAEVCPGLVYVSLSAYGSRGSWAERRGFDSLVQSATGFNMAEAQAAGSRTPKALPVQILDHATGLLLAFAAQAALLRQQREGGSWHVRLSLAQTAQWLRGLGRLPAGLDAPKPSFDDLLEDSDTGFGRLVAVRHAAHMAETPSGFARPAMPPGTHEPAWPS